MADDEDAVDVEVIGRRGGHLVLQRPDGTTGELRRLREGAAIPPGSELVSVEHQEHGDGEACRLRMTTIHRVGPSRHSTTAYRDGWDATFKGEAN